MIARVIIGVPTLIKGGFEYSFEGELKKFSLVKVPFRNSTELGLVDAVYFKSLRKTKNIKSVISPGPVFTNEQSLLAQKIAEGYIASYEQTLLGFLPRLNLRDLQKLGGPGRLIKNKYGKTRLLLADLDQRTEYFWQSIPKDGQNLIILPGIKLIEKVYLRSKKYSLPDEIVLWHSAVKSGEKAKVWQKILSGENITVVGTRDALLLPYRSLKVVFIDDPTNFAYQEDQRPYYHAYKVSAYLKNIFNASLILGEDIPDLYSFVALKNKKIELIEKDRKIKIVSLPQHEKAQKHPDLFDDILKGVNQNNKLCVIGPWRKEARVVCQDCNSSVVCPACGGEHFDQKTNHCAQCLKINSVAICRNCKSSKLKYVGFSYKNIKDELSRQFPKRAIAEADEDISRADIVLTNLNQLDQLPPIFIKAYLPYFDLMQNNPNLGARQTLFKKIVSLRNFGIRDVYISKSDEEELLFVNWLKDGDWRSFLTDELKQRKEFGLPPYKKGVQVVSKVSKSEKPPKIIADTLEKLKPFAKIIDREKDKTLLIFDKSEYPQVMPHLRNLSEHNIRVESDPMELF